MTAPTLPPPGWRETVELLAGRMFIGEHPNVQGLALIYSEDEIDGKTWRHLSLSRRSRMPSYDDLQRAQRAFLDVDWPAYQVFARAAEHVNLHNFCLHLWQPVGFDPFPGVIRGEAAR